MSIQYVSAAQRGLWFTQRLDPQSSAYLLWSVFRLTGEVSRAALQGAVDLVVARHEALRTGFEERDGEVVRMVHAEVEVPVEVEDVTDLEGFLEVETARPFDLSHPPLLRVTLARLGPGEHALLVCLHHIIADDASLEVLWRELSEAYSAMRRGAQPDLPPDPPQESAYLVWERDWLASPEFHDQLERWRRTLDGAAVLDLPGTATAGAPAWRGGVRQVWLPAEEVAAIRAFSVSAGVTPFMTMLAIYGGLLHRWTAQADGVIGTPVSMRDRPEFDNVVGMLLNTVALRLHWGDNPSLREAARRARRATFEGIERRHVPFDRVAAVLPRLRAADGNPVFQASFAYHGGGRGQMRTLHLDGLTVRPYWYLSRVAKFPLTVTCAEDDGRLMCVVEWSYRWLDDDLGELILHHFLRAVRYAVRHPDEAVGDWPLTDSVEPYVPAWAGTQDVPWS